MRYFFKSARAILLSALLLGVSCLQVQAVEGQLSFTGSVVDPGCELQRQGISCYQTGKIGFQYTALPLDKTALTLKVGESLFLTSPSSRLNSIEVNRLAEDEVLISLSFN